MDLNPATVGDLTNRGFVVTNDTAAATWLDVAWRALKREVPGLSDLVSTGQIDPDDVIDVVAAATLRVLRNPEGLEQESGALDDYTESWKRADASRDVYFTAAELRRLLPAVTPTAGSFKYS